MQDITANRYLTKIPKLQNGGQTASSTNAAEETGKMCRKMKLGPYLSLCMKTNSSPAVVVHAFNSSTLEAEVGKSLFEANLVY